MPNPNETTKTAYDPKSLLPFRSIRVSESTSMASMRSMNRKSGSTSRKAASAFSVAATGKKIRTRFPKGTEHKAPAATTSSLFRRIEMVSPAPLSRLKERSSPGRAAARSSEATMKEADLASPRRSRPALSLSRARFTLGMAGPLRSFSEESGGPSCSITRRGFWPTSPGFRGLLLPASGSRSDPISHGPDDSAQSSGTMSP